jgi:hypothetical protein
MTTLDSFSTWSALLPLDFKPDDRVLSDELPGLSLDFGTWRLNASHTINRHFVPIVLCSGVIRTPRTLASVSFEMPRQVESREQLDLGTRSRYREPCIAGGGSSFPMRVSTLW